MNALPWIVAIGGWLVALLQFFFSYRERRIQHAEDYLERTLKYLIGGPHQRAIGLSLLESVWLHKKERLNVITPVLVSQFIHVMLEADQASLEQEERNAVRMMFLLRECLPYSRDEHHEKAEVMECIMKKASHQDGILITPQTLRLWYETLGGNIAYFDAENSG